MLQRQMQHLFLYIPIFCAAGLFGFGGINMDNKYLNEVLKRLESYRKKEQQIELLRYELQHAKQVSPTELIEAMTFQTRDADGSQTDLYPKDVPGIALSYQHIAAQLNEEAVGELISRYTALCHERDRLLHYIGLLDKRQQEIDGIYEAADADRSTAAELKEEYTQRMATARDEADRLVRSAVDEANRKGDEIVDGAHRQASYIIKKAEGEIAQEKRKAYAELRSDISGLAVDIAEQMVGREINGADQAGLVEDFIRNAGDDK